MEAVGPRARGSRALGSGAVAPLCSLEQLPKLEDRVHLEGAIKLGSGSLGVVILVQDRQTPGRQLAVKVISLQLVREQGTDEARVWREVQVMQELHHPHLVRLVDVLACWNRVPHVASDPPHVCIAMEYVADSEPLSKAVRRAGPCPVLAMQVLPQLAAALALMHRRGLVHRDVWSENVLVDGRTGHAVLVDLGCAEYMGSEPPVNSKLNIPYMSPEAAKGLRQAPADDCWALGLVLTELLTGKFVADRMGRSDWPIHFSPQVLAEAMHEAVLHGGALLGRICTQLLDKMPGQRLPMAEVVAQCLAQGALGGGPRAWPPERPGVTSPGRAAVVVAPPALPPTASQPSALGTRDATARALVCAAAKSYFPPPRALSALVSPGSASHTPSLDVSFTTAAPQPPLALAEGCSSGSTAGAGFFAGQQVQYRPRASPTAPLRAVVLGRSPCGRGWQLQVEGGAVADVEDAEAWRLTAVAPRGQAWRSSTEAGPGAATQLSDALQPVASAPQQAVSSSAAASAALAGSAAGARASPVRNAVAAQPRGVPRLAALPWAHTLPTGTVGPPSLQEVIPMQSPKGRPARPREAVAPEAAPWGIGALACSPTAAALAPGRRVAYTARHNGQRYLGTIVGRRAGHNGWHVVLDVGEKKDVDDGEVWRLSPLAAG